MVGFYLKRMRLALLIFGVMTSGLFLLLVPAVLAELHGNPVLSALGIDAGAGNLEGKEIHFGVFYNAINMTIPAGTLVGAQDSFTSLTGAPFILEKGKYYHAERSAGESKHLYRFVANARSYSAKDKKVLRLCCAPLNITNVIFSIKT